MEWLYGLLIGSSFTALLMHLAHRGHQSELGLDKKVLEPKIKEPWYLPDTKEQFSKNVRADVAAHFAKNDVVDTLEDVPTDCTCDWHGDQRMCEEEPRVWYRTMKDEDCPRHRADDGWLRLQLYQERTDR